MKLPPFRLAAVDIKARSLVLFDGCTGALLTERFLPEGFFPLELTGLSAGHRAFLAGQQNKDGSSLFVLQGAKGYAYQLPLALPVISQLTAAQNGHLLYFVDNNNRLYKLDTRTLCLQAWGQSEQGHCVGLAADDWGIYTLWEYQQHGFLTVFHAEGSLLWQLPLPGIPTHITIHPQGSLLIPLTSSDSIGEGLLRINKKMINNSPYWSECDYFLYNQEVSTALAYPCHMALAPEEHLLYLVNEELGSIAILDLDKGKLLRHIKTEKALRCLYLLPGGDIGLASCLDSELLLVDLLAGQVLFSTQLNRTLLPYLLVLPH